jgi:hypothetical protein
VDLSDGIGRAGVHLRRLADTDLDSRVVVRRFLASIETEYVHKELTVNSDPPADFYLVRVV